jgi:hypothetical protein
MVMCSLALAILLASQCQLTAMPLVVALAHTMMIVDALGALDHEAKDEVKNMLLMMEQLKLNVRTSYRRYRHCYQYRHRTIRSRLMKEVTMMCLMLTTNDELVAMNTLNKRLQDEM